MNRIAAIGGGVAVLGILAAAAWYGLSQESAGPGLPTRLDEAAAPAVPGSPAEAAETAPATPSFDVVRIEPDGAAVIAGRAVAGATVAVKDGSRILGTVTADTRGEWVLIPTEKLAPGTRELTLEATGPDGTTVAGEAAVTLVVPQPNRDVAGRPQQPGTGGALAVLSTPDSASRVLQAPGAGAPVGATVVDAMDYDRDGRIMLGGRAQPGADIQVYVDNALVGRTEADSSGRWSLAPDRLLEPGRHTLRVDSVGAAGKVTARAEVPFERRPLDDTAKGDRAVVVLPGNNLWAIARRSYGEGPRYTLIFGANQEQIRDPDLIYPGQIFIMPANTATR